MWLSTPFTPSQVSVADNSRQDRDLALGPKLGSLTQPTRSSASRMPTHGDGANPACKPSQIPLKTLR